LLGGIAVMLTASVAWSMAEFSRWVIVLIGLSGLLGISKAVGELATGADLGPLALLGNILLIVALFAIASVFWRRVPADQAQLAA
jgi:asparagine N-glycosylation enzyme membrane subunit Stt3